MRGKKSFFINSKFIHHQSRGKKRETGLLLGPSIDWFLLGETVSRHWLSNLKETVLSFTRYFTFKRL